MRPLRELKESAWYEIRTSVNNRKPLFQSHKALRLFAKVLEDTSERFDLEIRGLCLKDALLVFYIKPADGFQLPRIMQWLKQTFAVRYNLLHGWTGHIWGDRYWSRIADGEPLPEDAEHCSGTVADTGAEELSPAGVGNFLGKMRAGIRLPSAKTRTRVRPLSGKPIKIPRKAASPPA
jgi:REP element-mobilizing transposase RayT